MIAEVDDCLSYLVDTDSTPPVRTWIISVWGAVKNFCPELKLSGKELIQEKVFDFHYITLYRFSALSNCI